MSDEVEQLSRESLIRELNAARVAMLGSRAVEDAATRQLVSARGVAQPLRRALRLRPGRLLHARRGQVTAGAELVDGFVRVWVQDDGPGIAPEDAAQVFDRYWKAKPGLHTGTGLGLFIAQGIVAAHGGRIWVDPLPKQGTRFAFTLPGPADQPAAARRRGVMCPAPLIRTGRPVLLVSSRIWR